MKKLSLITPSHSTGDACMDAGGRATQEAKAEGWDGGELHHAKTIHKNMPIINSILISTLLTACATDPDKMQAAYVSPVEYQNYTCDQIALEMRYISQRANELYGALDKEAGNDSAQMALGLILFWPALFFLEGGDDTRAAEYSRLKGQREALEHAAIQKQCDPVTIPKFEEPKPSEPEKDQKTDPML